MTARGCTEKQERASPSDAEGGARIFAEEKREMGHLLCFYLLELGMAAAWCRWVICREVDLPALLRTARTVWSGERQVLGELLLVRRRWTEGEETERFRQAWRKRSVSSPSVQRRRTSSSSPSTCRSPLHTVRAVRSRAGRSTSRQMTHRHQAAAIPSSSR